MPARSANTLAALLLLFGGGVASAQARAVAGAGVLLPVGDFAEVADPGIAAVAGMMLEVGSGGLAVGALGSYGRSVHASGGSRSDLYGLTGFVGYVLRGLGQVEVTPHVGLGALVHARRSSAFSGLDLSRAGPAVAAGLHATMPIRRLRAFASGTYAVGMGDLDTDAFPTEVVTVTVGATIPFGS